MGMGHISGGSGDQGTVGMMGSVTGAGRVIITFRPGKVTGHYSSYCVQVIVNKRRHCGALHSLWLC